MRKKVYVTNKGAHDYSPANSYGDVVFLTEGPVSPFRVNTLYRQIVQGLENSTEDDYLVISSLPILCALASAILTHKHKRINYLIFLDGAYVERTVKVDALL